MKKILVIDTSKEVSQVVAALAKVLAGILKDPLRVKEKISADKGLEYIKEHHKNIIWVICDAKKDEIAGDQITGLDLLKIIKKSYSDIMVTIMSWRPQDDKEPAKALKADGFLVKSFGINELREEFNKIFPKG